MPRYDYLCPEHGVIEVEKPAADAGREEYCVACIRPGPTDHHRPMRRLYARVAVISRPDGYSLKPGDRGYWALDRAAEVSHLPRPDANSNLSAGWEAHARQALADEDRGYAEAARALRPGYDEMKKVTDVARYALTEPGHRARD